MIKATSHDLGKNHSVTIARDEDGAIKLMSFTRGSELLTVLEGNSIALLQEALNAVPEEKVYWLSPVGDTDDFGHPIGGTIIDGATRTPGSPWALMTPESFEVFGIGRLGLGYGQKYEKQADGRWLKVEG